MKTLFLMPSDWDLRLDTNGNIGLAEEPYALAQDVASAVRLFDGELWYDTRKGVPHFDEALGRVPSYSLYRHHLEEAAKTVEGVVAAKATLLHRDGRILSGNISFIDNFGKAHSVQL